MVELKGEKSVVLLVSASLAVFADALTLRRLARSVSVAAASAGRSNPMASAPANRANPPTPRRTAVLPPMRNPPAAAQVSNGPHDVKTAARIVHLRAFS